MHDTMSIVQMPWKVAIIHIQSAINTTFLKGITWNLVHTFIRVSSSTYIPFFFLLKILKFWGICWKNKKMLKTISISQIFTISKIWVSCFYPILFRVCHCFPIVFIFPNARVTAIPANPYFWPKMAEHDVTLTSLTADLSQVWNSPSVNMCRIDVGKGSESFVALFFPFLSYARKRTGGQGKILPRVTCDVTGQVKHKMFNISI